MFHYIDNKAFLKRAQNLCSEIMEELRQELLEKGISSQAFLVGSGARNMVMQNGDGPIDFDYNLNIQKCNDINQCKAIKETVRNTFNHVLHENGLPTCDDSTSSLTTKPMHFKNEINIDFNIDVCIVAKNNDGYWFRLIHSKTGFSYYDTYKWEQAPYSNDIKYKADAIKKVDSWPLVREEYKKIKNKYLTNNDHNHPSFICYIEAVNNVYNTLHQKHIL